VKFDEESKLYCDIYILTESIKNKKHIEQLALANDKRLAQLASVNQDSCSFPKQKKTNSNGKTLKTPSPDGLVLFTMKVPPP